VRALRLDVNNQHDLVAALQGSNALISAVSYSVNYQIARGVMPPEVCVPGELMIQELGKRALKITKRITETWS
jgi:saccharopine dehydrogenase-like NADP-dependent oxidoreductase